MNIRIEVLLDEDQLNGRGVDPETVKDDILFAIQGALDVHSNPRWPRDTILDFEVRSDIVA